MKLIAVILGFTWAVPQAVLSASPAVPGDFRIDGVLVQGQPSPPPPPPAGVPAPQATSTIVWDTRAGGKQNFQAMTSLSQMQAAYGGVRNSGGATQFFESNVDGRGTKARGCQWAAPHGSEQECYLGTEGQRVRAPAAGWYTQFKMRLGKAAGAGGVGNVDQWTLTGVNGHQKTFIWNRANSAHRIYMVIRPSDTKFSIDGLNWSSPLWSTNPYRLTGQVVTITAYFSPADGVVKAWVNDVQVLNATGQKIGDSALVDIQESVTTFPGQQQVQYMWDTIVWY